MTSLHAIKVAIPDAWFEAAAFLMRRYGIRRFRVTGQPHSTTTNPMQYYYNARWDNWSSEGIDMYARDFDRGVYTRPTPAEVAEVQGLFEAMP